jgi:DNA-binding cell septation regulator SpoVG
VLKLKRLTREPKELKQILNSAIANLKRRKTMIKVERLHRLNNSSQVKAFADVVFYEQVLIKGVKIVKNKDNNLFVAMPSQKAKDGKWSETVAILDKVSREQMRIAVLTAYNS